MRDKRVVIVGGGIGGLAAAVALGRTGWRVTVLERNAALGAAGAGLLLAANAVHALRALGLGDQLTQVATDVTTVGFRGTDGRWLSRLDPLRMQQQLGARTVAIARPALHEMLIGALDPTTDVRTGVEVRAVPQADVVVACDGIGSAIRGILVPHARLVDAGYAAWRALVPADRAPAIVTFAETLGAGYRFGCAPLGRDGVYWYATAPGTVRTTAPAAQLTELAHIFAGWHHPIGELIAATDPQSLLHHPIADIASVPPMAFGTVALLGDAAHPMTPNLGQGACQALEDAVVLADCLADVEDTGQVPNALARYDRVRRPRVARVVRQSRLVGRVYQARTPVTTRLRDLAITATPDWLTEAGIRALAGWRPRVSTDHRP